MGKPTDEQRDAYEAVCDNLYTVLDEIEPGRTTSEIAAAFPDTAGEHADRHGVNDRWQLTTNHWAYGPGLQLYEVLLIWRGLSPDHSIEIEAEITIVVEAQESAGKQGACVGEMVVVRDDGVELLSQ